MIERNGTEVFVDACLDAGVRPIDLIVRTAVWVSPESFRYLPVWYPEAWRKAPLYNSTWTSRYTNTNRVTGIKVDKSEANERAAKALAKALGAKDTPGWTCCHIWGIDDEKFEKSNSIVQDSRFYSCTANMVYLPTPLKAFTDALPDIKAMLRACAFHLYGWVCDHPDVLAQAQEICSGRLPEGYPEFWPAPGRNVLPPNTVSFNERIRRSADQRKKAIRSAMDKFSDSANFPKKQVQEALTYWKIAI